MREIERRRNKTKRIGGPKLIKSPLHDSNNPDNYPSLMKYLEAKGKLKHTTYAVMMKARNMYLAGSPVKKIGADLCIEPSIIDRWILCFSWDEERDRRLFEQFRKVNGVDRLYGQNIGARHDRIAGTIEQIAERRLQEHADGEELSVKDLKGITDVVKATQEIRRTVRGEKSNNSNPGIVNNTLIVGVPGNLEKVSNALIDAMDRPRLTGTKTTTIAVGREDAIGHDTEYES